MTIPLKPVAFTHSFDPERFLPPRNEGTAGGLEGFMLAFGAEDSFNSHACGGKHVAVAFLLAFTARVCQVTAIASDSKNPARRLLAQPAAPSLQRQQAQPAAPHKQWWLLHCRVTLPCSLLAFTAHVCARCRLLRSRLAALCQWLYSWHQPGDSSCTAGAAGRPRAPAAWPHWPGCCVIPDDTAAQSPERPAAVG